MEAKVEDRIDNAMDKLQIFLRNRNFLAATTRALEIAQLCHRLWTDEIHVKYRVKSAGEHQVDEDLLSVLKLALLDAADYKLSDATKRRMLDAIESAERFVEDGAADHVVVTMQDGKKIKLTAQLMEE